MKLAVIDTTGVVVIRITNELVNRNIEVTTIFRKEKDPEIIFYICVKSYPEWM